MRVHLCKYTPVIRTDICTHVYMYTCIYVHIHKYIGQQRGIRGKAALLGLSRARTHEITHIYIYL